MRTRLTIRRLEAMREALLFRTAGEIEQYEDDEDAPTYEDYDTACNWVTEEIGRRERRRKRT